MSIFGQTCTYMDASIRCEKDVSQISALLLQHNLVAFLETAQNLRY